MLKLQYFGHLSQRTDSLGKTNAGKDWRQEKKGTTEDEMAGWHHWFDGHEFEQALGVGDWQGGLVYCSPWGRKGSYTTEWLNWTEMTPGNHGGGWKNKRESGVQYRTWFLGICILRVDLWVHDRRTAPSKQTYRAPQNERTVHHSPRVSTFEARSAYKIT